MFKTTYKKARAMRLTSSGTANAGLRIDKRIISRHWPHSHGRWRFAFLGQGHKIMNDVTAEYGRDLSPREIEILEKVAAAGLPPAKNDLRGWDRVSGECTVTAMTTQGAKWQGVGHYNHDAHEWELNNAPWGHDWIVTEWGLA